MAVGKCICFASCLPQYTHPPLIFFTSAQYVMAFLICKNNFAVTEMLWKITENHKKWRKGFQTKTTDTRGHGQGCIGRVGRGSLHQGATLEGGGVLQAVQQSCRIYFLCLFDSWRLVDACCYFL